MSFHICLVSDVCCMQLLATIAFLVLVAFEADVGCLDDDAVKRENGKLEHGPFSPFSPRALGNIWVWDSRAQSDWVKDYGSSIPSEKLYSLELLAINGCIVAMCFGEAKARRLPALN